MDKSYKLVSLDSKDEIIKDIAKYEMELKKKAGLDIVLIAYTPNI